MNFHMKVTHTLPLYVHLHVCTSCNSQSRQLGGIFLNDHHFILYYAVPIVEFSAREYNGSETLRNLTIGLTRSGDILRSLSVTISIESSDAAGAGKLLFPLLK